MVWLSRQAAIDVRCDVCVITKITAWFIYIVGFEVMVMSHVVDVVAGSHWKRRL